MPKTNTQKNVLLVNEYGREYFAVRGEHIFCKVCHIEIKGDRRTFIERHCKSKKHSQNIKLLPRNEGSDDVLSTSLSTCSQTEFYKDLCEMMVCANIPFNKLQNPAFNNFLEKYTAMKIP